MGVIHNEIIMLEGNINRLCVATDEKELEEMRDWAKKRIDIIFEYRVTVLKEAEIKRKNLRHKS